jgi:hypothetical protein
MTCPVSLAVLLPHACDHLYKWPKRGALRSTDFLEAPTGLFSSLPSNEEHMCKYECITPQRRLVHRSPCEIFADDPIRTHKGQSEP